jgi:ketosteroid isomerase-like protein
MRALARAAFALTLLVLVGCEATAPWKERRPEPIAYGPQTERQVERALQRYSGLIVAMDANAIAEMYAPDGVWERQSGPLHGRDAIRQAVASSPARVLSNEMTTGYMSYNGPAVVHTGQFKQSVRLPNGKIVDASGRFEATWMRGPNGEWWIRRMVTRPGK